MIIASVSCPLISCSIMNPCRDKYWLLEGLNLNIIRMNDCNWYDMLYDCDVTLMYGDMYAECYITTLLKYSSCF